MCWLGGATCCTVLHLRLALFASPFPLASSACPAPAPPAPSPAAAAGKMDAKKRLEDNVQQLMSSNIVQCMGSMLDTVVF